MKYYNLGDRVIAACPKAASTAIDEALRLFEIQPHAVEGRVIVFIRHPVDRLQSAYRHFSERGWVQRNWGRNASLGYEEFVDAVLEGESNRHWDSQTELLRHAMPNEWYRFDCISEVFPVVTGMDLPRLNVSTPLELDQDYRRAALLNFYEDDLRRWKHALQTAR